MFRSIYLLFFFVVFSTLPSFATRARLLSIMNSRHVIDEQHLFYNPLALNHMPSLLALESGADTSNSLTTSTSNAETLLSYRPNTDQIFAFSIGHQEQAITVSRKTINDVGLFTFEMQQNPTQLFFANKSDDTYYAGSIGYSHFENKLNQIEESSLVLNFGIEAGAWQYFMKYIPVNDVNSIASRFDGAGYVEGNVHFISDGVQGYATYSSSQMRGFSGTSESESHLLQSFRMGIVDSKVLDGENTFWSVDLVSVSLECQKKGGVSCGKTSTAVMVPVVIGFETAATSWLTLRSSIKQNFLFDQSKDEVGYPVGTGGFATGVPSEFISGVNSTEMAFGLGFNFNRARVDAVLLAGGSQILNTTDLLSQVGVVYDF